MTHSEWLQPSEAPHNRRKMAVAARVRMQLKWIVKPGVLTVHVDGRCKCQIYLL